MRSTRGPCRATSGIVEEPGWQRDPGVRRAASGSSTMPKPCGAEIVRCRASMLCPLPGRQRVVLGAGALGPRLRSTGVVRWIDRITDGVDAAFGSASRSPRASDGGHLSAFRPVFGGCGWPWSGRRPSACSWCATVWRPWSGRCAGRPGVSGWHSAAPRVDARLRSSPQGIRWREYPGPRHACSKQLDVLCK